MRTTLDIEDDILDAAKEIARMQHMSIGQVISRLLREALAGRKQDAKNEQPKGVGGFRPFASRGVVVTNEAINNLRDQEGV